MMQNRGQQMNKTKRFRSLLVAALALGSAGSYAATRKIMPPSTPAHITPPAGNTVFLLGHATGVQIYVCKAKADDPSKFEWSFTAPEADLTNEHGKKIAKHYAGPTWEASDGSKVVGKKNAETPAPRAGAVPWLLLEAKTHEGTGKFARVTYIQCVDTEGGVAPAAGWRSGPRQN